MKVGKMVGRVGRMRENADLALSEGDSALDRS